LAHQIGEYLPQMDGRQVGNTATGVVLGGVLGSILGGDK
jgi:uncharacterized protein YcfJ